MFEASTGTRVEKDHASYAEDETAKGEFCKDESKHQISSCLKRPSLSARWSSSPAFDDGIRTCLYHRRY